jgi:hypothetical protein
MNTPQVQREKEIPNDQIASQAEQFREAVNHLWKNLVVYRISCDSW